MLQNSYRLLYLIVALSIVACNTSDPDPAEPTAPVVSVSPDLTLPKLLSDEELRTIPLPQEPVVNDEYADWMRSNLNPIRSITYDNDYSDLQFLENVLEGKRLVQLGESSHGSKEFNHVKVRLIKYLHEIQGYDVIAFESGLYEGYNANQRVQALSATSLMRFIFGVWNTEEVVELFEYVKETQSTSRPLIIAGLDVLLSSSSFYDNVGGFVQSLPELEPEFSLRLANQLNAYKERLLAFGLEGCYSDESVSCDSLVNILQQVKSGLEESITEIMSIQSSSTEFLYVRQTTQSALIDLKGALLRYGPNGANAPNLRDEGMASNVEFLLDEIHPDKKIILWAHNAHITYELSDRTNVGGGISGVALSNPMGSYLYHSRSEEIYTIGLYMVRGASNINNGDELEVEPPADNSLEALSYHQRLGAFFIDVNRNQQKVQGNAFIFDRIATKYWGSYPYEMIPSDQYDAILIIDESSRCQYL